MGLFFFQKELLKQFWRQVVAVVVVVVVAPQNVVAHAIATYLDRLNKTPFLIVHFEASGRELPVLEVKT